jgi:hypothetical protein
MRDTLQTIWRLLSRPGPSLHAVWITIFFVMMLGIPATGSAQSKQTKPTGTEPVPKPAIRAIIDAFDKYEVVAMPEDHGLKDLDDLILALVRNPALPSKLNDIVIECGNSLYQPILDRYMVGMDVPLTAAGRCGEIRRNRYVAGGASDSSINSILCCVLSTRRCRLKNDFEC